MRTKSCSKCKLEFPTGAFQRDKHAKDGLTCQCKACRKISREAWKSRNPDKVRLHKKREHSKNHQNYLDYQRSSRRKELWFKWKLEKQFGITVEDFEILYESQLGKCAICRNKLDCGKCSNKRLHIDHDHKTGAVRGLLCFRCNTGIGSFGDSVENLQRAAEYLQGKSWKS